eukprot:364516-Chlamydomonas_euryale.AAC.20
MTGKRTRDRSWGVISGKWMMETAFKGAVKGTPWVASRVLFVCTQAAQLATVMSESLPGG